MVDRTLGNLLKLRRASVEEATTTLAAALAAEEAAAAAEIAMTSSIRAELSAASAAGTDDATVEALAAWLPLARKCQTKAREQRCAAEATTVRVRAALAAARAAEATISSFIDAREAAERASQERRIQQEFIERISNQVASDDM